MISLVVKCAVSIVLITLERYQHRGDLEQNFSERLAIWRQTHIKEFVVEDELSFVRQSEERRNFTW